MTHKTGAVAIIGTGYVADYYMQSAKLHPQVAIIGAFDSRSDRLQAFCDYWKVPAFNSLDALLAALPADGLVLNLTNPTAHYEVTKKCLDVGRHVYSEKPLATDFEEARALVALAQSRGLLLGGAPCSYLSEAAMTLAEAVKTGVCGRVRLVYGELDDGYISQAPFAQWFSESGAPWPYEDEMRTGCVLEHAGYVLTWMIAIFGSIRSITAFSDHAVDKGLDPECTTPDTSISVLQFESGPILRLTITIVAPHNHELMLVGDRGTITVNDTWNNYSKVMFRKRFSIRRSLIESPIASRLRFGGKKTGGRVARRGSATMDYFLGPVELLRHISAGGSNLCSADLALHTTEATLALQNAGPEGTFYRMRTTCDPLPLLGERAAPQTTVA
ncbi:MAG: Gfo/Idh/MocA family protein [Roseinatronobacter sp.]